MQVPKASIHAYPKMEKNRTEKKSVITQDDFIRLAKSQVKSMYSETSEHMGCKISSKVTRAH